jgi:suppressor of fused-like protein
MSDEEAPGRDAIASAMARLCPEPEVGHWGAVSKLPGDPGIDGISAYDAGTHWHFVTFGLTELWSKVTDDSHVSGFGYEFTMRVRKTDAAPPSWVLNLLQRLGDAVFKGAQFGSGHTLAPGGAITGRDSSSLRALLFVDDPELPVIATPHGSVAFLQVVGITRDELDAIKANREQVGAMRTQDPLFITDPTR